ncbi:MAG: hypothetical protein MUD17_01455 [Gemmatimonadaceae bacterium]|jgi:hypothetical protein|nr:hypothetical protein [Gemmatimonadaceae bacterium]
MSFTAAPDTRRAMRDALHRLVHETDGWSRPSLTVFRNRLLDEVSSDARPLANLLVEAIDRGVLDALPQQSLTPAAWSARSTPFVMRWVADRFLQPEVARWAVEAWGYALGCIDTSQLTAAVDAPEPTPMAPSWALADVAGANAAALTPPGSAVALPAGKRALTSPPSTGGTAPWRGTAAPTRVPPGRTGAPGTPYRPPSRLGSASNSWAVRNAPRVAIGTAAIAMLSYVYIFVSAAMREPTTLAVAEAPAVARSAPLEGQPAPGMGNAAFGVPSGSSEPPGANTAEIPTTYGPGDGQTTGSVDAAQAGDALGASRAALAATAAARGIGLGGQATRVPLTAGSGTAPSIAMTRLPAEGATPTAFLELAARSSVRTSDAADVGASSATLASPLSPGVPSITRNALPLSGDIASAQRVRAATRPVRERPLLASPFANGLPNTLPTSEPTRRVAGDVSRVATVPVTDGAPTSGGANARDEAAPARGTAPRAANTVATRLPAAAAPAAPEPSSRTAPTPGLDQLRLRSGRRITGRVEVIRTTSVVFRDAETGLRYEFAKDDVNEIITEFGSTVRFRSASSVARGTDRRGASVAGRYEVTYDAARVNGSPACRDLWRGPSGRDLAVVQHRAGDDTLSVSFEGGDRFPSVLDADGFFSSTFRIMPGQEQLATALTTRLTGRFGEDGTIALQVNVIGYRRVQGTRGVACHIIVDATGRRAG